MEKSVRKNAIALNQGINDVARTIEKLTYIGMKPKLGKKFVSKREGIKSLSMPKWPKNVFLHAHNNNWDYLEKVLEIVAFTRHYNSVYDKKPILPDRDPSFKLTLVIDLDGTLYSNCECYEDDIILSDNSTSHRVPSAQYGSSINIEEDYDTLVVRPFARDFLRWASKHYEIIFWTAATEEYARPRIKALCGGKIGKNSGFKKNKLGKMNSTSGMYKNDDKSINNECIEVDSPCYSDKEKKADRDWVSYVLYRDSCSYCGGNFVKDLRRLGRPLDSVVLLDDNLISATPTMYNIIPIKRFDVNQQSLEESSECLKKGEMDDDLELLRIVPLLKKISLKSTVPSVLKDYCDSDLIELSIRKHQHKLETRILKQGSC